MLLQMAKLHCFFRLSCVPLYVCVCDTLCIHSSVNRPDLLIDLLKCHFICCSSESRHQTQHCVFRTYVGRISDLTTPLSQLLPNPQALQESGTIISETSSKDVTRFTGKNNHDRPSLHKLCSDERARLCTTDQAKRRTEHNWFFLTIEVILLIIVL